MWTKAAARTTVMPGSDLRADEWYRCPDCPVAFADQIRFERHLFDEHDRLRDVLPSILDG